MIWIIEILLVTMPAYLLLLVALIARRRKGDRDGSNFQLAGMCFLVADAILMAILMQAESPSATLCRIEGLCFAVLIPLLFSTVTLNSGLPRFNKYAIAMWLSLVLLFLPDISFELRPSEVVGNVYDDAPLLGVSFFVGGHLAYQINWLSVVVLLQMVIFSLAIIRITRLLRRHGARYVGAAKAEIAWSFVCGVCVLGARAVPLSVWHDPAWFWIFFMTSSIILSIMGVLLWLGYDLNPVAYGQNRLMNLDDFVFENGELARQFVLLMEDDRIYLETGLLSADVAKRLETTPDAFNRLVWARYGKSFPEVINDRRIAYAKEFILSPEAQYLSPDELAQRCGYRDAFALTRMFIRIVGQGPAEWKAQQLSTYDPSL